MDRTSKTEPHDLHRLIQSARAGWVMTSAERCSSAINYDHHSASSINLFCASTAMWVLEKVLGVRQPVGAPAHRGVAVEDGVTHGLMNPVASLAECTKIAIVK